MKKKLSLTVSKLTCKRNSISIFNPLSFKVSEGQMLIIKGKNGRGKTTLIHCLAGLLSYQGLVKWKGVEGKIGYIGHKFGLKEYETVYDFIKFWKAVYGSKVSIDEVVEFCENADSKLKFFSNIVEGKELIEHNYKMMQLYSPME